MRIGILSASPFPDVRELYSEYRMTNSKTGHIFSGNFALCVLDLSQLENVPKENGRSVLPGTPVPGNDVGGDPDVIGEDG